MITTKCLSHRADHLLSGLEIVSGMNKKDTNNKYKIRHIS